MTRKRILMGLHDRTIMSRFRVRAEEGGHEVDGVAELDDMKARVRETNYDIYLMDANLGHPGSPNVSSAIEIYDLVRERVESGDAMFLVTSLSSEAVGAARDAGIPAADGYYDRDEIQELLG